MLSIEHLRFWYKPGRDVLRDISFSVKQGDILCLLGPNGTGKTTLLRVSWASVPPEADLSRWMGRPWTASLTRPGPNSWPMCPNPPPWPFPMRPGR